MKLSYPLRALLPLGVVLSGVGFAGAEPPEAPSGYVESIEVDGTRFQIVQLAVVGGGQPIDGAPGFQRQIMQEGQLNGAALDDQINYVAGAFGFWETGNGGERATYVLPPGQGNPLFLDQQFVSLIEIDNWTWALYGQATYDVLEWLSLTAGVRYTQDKKGLTFQQTDIKTEQQPARPGTRCSRSGRRWRASPRPLRRTGSTGPPSIT